MLSTNCFNLDQSKILSSGDGLIEYDLPSMMHRGDALSPVLLQHGSDK